MQAQTFPPEGIIEDIPIILCNEFKVIFNIVQLRL